MKLVVTKKIGLKVKSLLNLFISEIFRVSGKNPITIIKPVNIPANVSIANLKYFLFEFSSSIWIIKYKTKIKIEIMKKVRWDIAEINTKKILNNRIKILRFFK